MPESRRSPRVVAEIMSYADQFARLAELVSALDLRELDVLTIGMTSAGDLLVTVDGELQVIARCEPEGGDDVR